MQSLFINTKDLHNDLNYSSSDINILAETRFNSQDPNDMYDISGYNLFQNDYLNSSNEITVIKVMTCENWTILGIHVYHSLKVSVRQLCEAISLVF